VTLNAERHRKAGSVINVSGCSLGGNGGHVEISLANLEGIHTAVDGHAANGFLGGVLTIDPLNLTLDGAFVSTLTPTLNGGLYEINLQADNDITLSTIWNLADPGGAATLTLSAGNNIILQNASATDQAHEQAAMSNTDEDDAKKRGAGPQLTRKVSRVTVILPKT
jgi:hypothetical protein